METKNMTIQESIESFLTWQAESRRASPVTVRNQRIDLDAFADFAERTEEIRTVEQLNPFLFDKYRRYEKERGVADSTWNRAATSIRSWLRYLLGFGLLPHPYHEIVPRIKEQNGKDVDVVESDDMDRIEQYLTGLENEGQTVPQQYFDARLRLIWSLFSKDGLRLAELGALSTGDINVLDSARSIASISIEGKGKRHRDTYLHPDTLDCLQGYMKARREYFQYRGIEQETERALFVSTKGKRLSTRQVEYIINKLGKDCGVESLACHRLRRTAVSTTVNNMPDLAALPLVAASFGHSCRILETHYLKVEGDKVVAAKQGLRKVA